MALQDFIKKHAETVEALEKESRTAWWNLAVTGDEKYSKQMQKTNIALRKIFSSADDYHFLLSQPPQSDPLMQRQITLLINDYIENQIPDDQIEEIVKLESDIEIIYTNFRAAIEDQLLSNNDIKQILVESQDLKKRQAAWEASKMIGEQVQEKILKLVKLRNISAERAGFDNFYTMRLKLQELDENKLFQLLEQLDEMTKPHWLRYKSGLDHELSVRFGISENELMPWHYQDPFFQEAPPQALQLDQFYQGCDIVEVSRAFYKAVGLDVNDILGRSDLFEREKKNQHAFCICIDRKQDVRILCNLRDNEYWMGTQLHELGHAVYDKNIDQTLPFILRTIAHVSSTEAIAMLFGRLSKNGDFLRQYCGLSSQAAQEIDAASRKQLASNLLVFTRWVLVMVYFERAMYQQPKADLNQLWWDYVERFQGVKRVPGRNKPDWASKIHLACAPVYYQNYLLGEMTASQLKHSLEKELRDEEFCTSPKVGEWLKTRFFSLGARHPWNEAIRLATGEKLNPQYFVKDIE